MLLKGLRVVLLGASGFAIATAAFAEGPKVGIEYRAGVTYDDGGFEETDDVDAQSETEIAVEYLNLTAEGEAAKHVKYMFSYSTTHNELELGNATLMLGDMFSVLVGRDKTAQGGWHGMDHYMEYTDLHSAAASAYVSGAKPFETFEDMVALNVNLAGTLTLQLVDDVKMETTTTVDDSGNETVTVTGNAYAKNDSNKGPAGILQWQGDFNGWMPLVQIGSYDLNNSQYYSIGIKGKVAGLGLMLNYLQDTRKNHSVDRDDPETDTISQIDVAFDYSFGGWTPYLAYNTFDYKQGGTDSDINTDTRNFDDNAQSISVGVVCNAVGSGYEPYLAIMSDSADVQDPKKAEGEAETRSNITAKLGVRGHF